jgi:O-6-methylguanine DNA methyltransferase
METPRPSLFALALSTAHGTFVAHYSDRGLARLDFPDTGKLPALQTVPSAIAVWHRLTRASVEAVLAGIVPPTNPPLDLAAGSDFQQRVWRELIAIPMGQCRTYGELAGRLGRPGGSRAVGGACGANPVPLLVPCHRVLAAGGKLGGFSGGLEWKRKLLAIERSGLDF